MRIEDSRKNLVRRLRSRRPEIEQAIFNRIEAADELGEKEVPQYGHGLRLAISAAVAYGLEALEQGEDRIAPVPPVLLAQARLAFRAGISLDALLRRYLDGYALFADYVLEEAEAGSMGPRLALRRVSRAQASALDRILAAVSDEFGKEQRAHRVTPQERRVDKVRRLLAGEPLDSSDLGYDFGGYHLGLVAVGTDAAAAFTTLADEVDCQPLTIPRDDGPSWAWLGTRRPLPDREIEGIVSSQWPEGVWVTVGEVNRGFAGWRRTHLQARAALPLVIQGRDRCVRYRNVALVASMLRDSLLVNSLRDLYLAPLEEEKDRGKSARETLWAYFRAGRRVSSAAAALGIDRHTVTNRLRSIEERLGRPLDVCSADVEAALKLEGFDQTAPLDPLRPEGQT